MPALVTNEHETAHPVRFSDLAASELAGDLRLNPAYTEYEPGELPHLCEAFGERLRQTLFDLGDVACWILHHAGAVTPSARAKVLDELAASSMIERPYLRKAVRVARAFPVDLRAEFPDKPQTWFEVLTERTAAASDTPQERQERRERLARECAGLNTRELRERLEAELRPAPGSEHRGSYLELDDAPPAEVTEAPPVVIADLGVEDVLPRLVRGLEKRFRDDNPGTPAMMVACVEDHLRVILPGFIKSVRMTA